MNSDYAQVMIMDQAQCMGCGSIEICMEIGVKDGLSLACQTCISTIFDKARQAIESEDTYKPEDICIRIDPTNNDEQEEFDL